MIKNLRKNKKGFTLIEIIVVVVILAVLMAVAVPSVLKYLDEADNAKYMAQARSVMTTAQTEVVKAFVGDKKITDAEKTTLTTPATYESGKNGMGTVSNIKIYTAANVSESGGTITIAAGAELTGSDSEIAQPDVKAVSCQIDDRYVVAVPNGKIFVSKTAPTTAE